MTKEKISDIKKYFKISENFQFTCFEDYFGKGLDKEVKEAVLNAAKVLEEKGAIVEEGNHIELMEKKGKYYKLYTNQFYSKMLEVEQGLSKEE